MPGLRAAKAPHSYGSAEQKVLRMVLDAEGQEEPTQEARTPLSPHESRPLQVFENFSPTVFSLATRISGFSCMAGMECPSVATTLDRSGASPLVILLQLHRTRCATGQL